MCRCWQATIKLCRLRHRLGRVRHYHLDQTHRGRHPGPPGGERMSGGKFARKRQRKAASAAVSGAVTAQRGSGRAGYRVRGQAPSRDASFNHAVRRRGLEGTERRELRAGLRVPAGKTSRTHGVADRNVPSDAPSRNSSMHRWKRRRTAASIRTPGRPQRRTSPCRPHSVTYTAKTIRGGRGLFLFHPLPLRSGSYISNRDFTYDRVVLDEELSWALFGSYDVAGQTVWIPK